MAVPVVDTPLADQTHVEQQSVSVDVSANYSDADVTDSITYSILGLPVGTGLTIDSETGVISGVPSGADASASPITATVRVTDRSGDTADVTLELGATGTPATFTPNVIYRQDGNADPNNLGVPVFTTLAGASGSMSAGDVCEVQADTPGGEVFISEGLDVSGFVGTSSNRYRWQVRTGDDAYLYQIGGDCLEGTGAAHLQFHGFNFGRSGMPSTPSGTATNGWSYATQGNNVEHSRTVDFSNVSFVRFSDCYFWGGRFYDSCNLRSSCPHIGFVDCTFSHTGSLDRSNAGTFGADHLVLVRCRFVYNGHDGASVKGKLGVSIDCIHDGDWELYASGDATRPFGLEGSKGTADYGPFFLQGNVFKNGVIGAAGESDPVKIISFGALVRRNYFVNFDRQAVQINPLQNSALPSSDIRLLHNTFYEIGSLFNSTDINISNAIGAANIDNGFQNTSIRNNVIAEIGDANSGGATSMHIRARYTNVGRSDSDGPDFPNAFRNFQFQDNLVDMITGTFFFDMRDGIGNVVAESLSDAETNFSSLVSGNQTVAPTFVNVANRFSNTLATVKAGLALDTGSNGLGDASVSATTTASGTSTTTVPVSDARVFAALRDPNNYNLSYFSDDLPREYVVIGANSVVEVTAVDYVNNEITIATAQTFANGADVWLADSDGTIWDNQGAGQ